MKKLVTITKTDRNGNVSTWESVHIGNTEEARNKAVRKHFGRKAYYAVSYAMSEYPDYYDIKKTTTGREQDADFLLCDVVIRSMPF